MKIRGRVDVYCTNLEGSYIAVASSEELDLSGCPLRIEIFEFWATDPLYKATRIGVFSDFDFRASELHTEITSISEVQALWGIRSNTESEWFEDDGWGALEGPGLENSVVQSRDKSLNFGSLFIARSARLLARLIRKVRRPKLKADESSGGHVGSPVEDNYIDPFQQLFTNDRSGSSPFTTGTLKQWLVDITHAALDASPWDLSEWAEFNPIPTILVPIAVTRSSVRFEILGLDFYEYTVECISDDHYEVRLVFTGNGRDESIF